MTANVWIVTHHAGLPEFGCSARQFELAKRLVLAGFDVSIIASDISKAALPIKPGDRFATQVRDGVRFVWLKSATRYTANDSKRVRNMLEFARGVVREGRSRFGETLPKPDMLIGTSPHLLAPYAASQLARRFSVPFIMEVRDLWPETFVAFGGLKRYHPIILALRWLERLLYRRARSVISLLPEAWKYIEQRGIAKDRIVWIPNGVACSTLAEDTRFGNPGPFTVMFLGAHNRANCLEDLIDAAALLEKRGTQARVVMVGDGKRKSSLIKRAEKLNITNVEFRDRVPRDQVSELAKTADAFVALREDTDLYQYGISMNKVFAYMSEGKPVILSGRIAHNYVDIANCGITISPRDPLELAMAIEKMMLLPEEERRAMGQRGIDYIREHHDWDMLASRLIDFLHKNVSISKSN
jgi:glycosyltransferase involved in cell wall biosynthesis